MVSACSAGRSRKMRHIYYRAFVTFTAAVFFLVIWGFLSAGMAHRLADLDALAYSTGAVPDRAGMLFILWWGFLGGVAFAGMSYGMWRSTTYKA